MQERSELFAGFAPCKWSEFNALAREERRSKFTMPGMDDMHFINAARKTIEQVLSGAKDEWRISECFLNEGGFYARDHIGAFETTWQFYSALLQSAAAFPAKLDPDVCAAFPAEELILIGRRKEPCDWRARWAEAGGVFYGKRMVALLVDPVWKKISAIGLPYPPFEFCSRMEQRSISIREWQQFNPVES